MSEKNNWRNFLIGLGICIIAVSVFLILTFSRTSPDRKSRPTTAPLVDIVEVKSKTLPIVINAMGAVRPARSVSILPQVNGKVIYLSPNLIPGGYVKAGDVLIRIEPKDFDLAAREANAEVSSAQLALEEQEGARAAAERELQMVGKDLALSDQGLRLANRELYVENARAQVEAAKSRLEQAQLARRRCVVKAPFDAQVSEKSVDIGHVVSTQVPVAMLVASEVAWIEGTLPVESLRWIDIPGVNGGTGASVTIRQKLSSKTEIIRQGKVLRLLPDLQEQGKLARVLIEVQDPFGYLEQDKKEGKGSLDYELPLLMGAFVHVEIQGHIIPDLIALPRNALREDNQVWLRDGDGLLVFRQVETVWSDDEAFYVQGDLAEGDAVITSRLSNPMPGMKVSTATDTAPATGHPTKDKTTEARSGQTTGARQ